MEQVAGNMPGDDIRAYMLACRRFVVRLNQLEDVFDRLQVNYVTISHKITPASSGSTARNRGVRFEQKAVTGVVRKGVVIMATIRRHPGWRGRFRRRRRGRRVHGELVPERTDLEADLGECDGQ